MGVAEIAVDNKTKRLLAEVELVNLKIIKAVFSDNSKIPFVVNYALKEGSKEMK